MSASFKRVGRVLRLREGCEAEYDRLHTAVWPEVLASIQAAGIRNYSIFRHGQWLFSYFELPVDRVTGGCTLTAEQSEICRRWEALMHELQEPLPESADDNWWVPTNEVFHWDGDT